MNRIFSARRINSPTRRYVIVKYRHAGEPPIPQEDKANQYDFGTSVDTQTSLRSISPPPLLRPGTFTVEQPRFPVDFLPRIESSESDPETVPSYIIPVTERATPKTAVRRGRTPRGRSYPVKNDGGLRSCRREIPPTRSYLVRPTSPVFSPQRLFTEKAVLIFSTDTDDENDENNNPLPPLMRGITVNLKKDKNGLLTRDTFLPRKPSYFFRAPKNFREMRIIQNQRKAEAEANVHKSKLLPINRDVLLDPRWEDNFYEHIERVENAKPKVCTWSGPAQKAKIEETARVKELSKKKEKQELLKELEMQNRIQLERLRHIAERKPKLEQGMIKRPDKAELQRREREKRLTLKKQNQMLAERLSRVKPVITTQKVAKFSVKTQTSQVGMNNSASSKDSLVNTLTDASSNFSSKDSLVRTLTDASSYVSSKDSLVKTLTDTNNNVSSKDSLVKTLTDTNNNVSSKDSLVKTLTDANRNLSRDPMRIAPVIVNNNVSNHQSLSKTKSDLNNNVSKHQSLSKTKSGLNNNVPRKLLPQNTQRYANNDSSKKLPPQSTKKYANNDAPRKLPAQSTQRYANSDASKKLPPLNTQRYANNDASKKLPPLNTQRYANNDASKKLPPLNTQRYSNNDASKKLPPLNTQRYANNDASKRLSPQNTQRYANKDASKKLPPLNAQRYVNNDVPKKLPLQSTQRYVNNDVPGKLPPQSTQRHVNNDVPRKLPPQSIQKYASNDVLRKLPPQSTKKYASNDVPRKLLPQNTQEDKIEHTFEEDRESTLDTSAEDWDREECRETSAKDTDRSDGKGHVRVPLPFRFKMPRGDQLDMPEIRAFLRFLDARSDHLNQEKPKKIDPDFGWSEYEDDTDEENDFFITHGGRCVINKKYMSPDDVAFARSIPELKFGNNGHESPAKVVFTESESEPESVHSEVGYDNYEADDENS